MATRDVSVRIVGKDELTKVLKGIRGNLSGFATVAKAAFAGFAVQQVTSFFKNAIDKAADAELRTKAMARAITNVGIDATRALPAAERLVKSLSRMTGQDDDDIAGAFGTLVTISGDYTASLQNMELVMDVAAFKHISLESAAQIVGRALTGNVRLLKEFGISSGTAGSQLDQLRAKVRGFAADGGSGIAGTMGKISVAWDNILESLGGAVGNALATESGGLIGALDSLKDWIDQNHGTIASAAETIIKGATGIVQLLAKLQGAPEWWNTAAAKANIGLRAGLTMSGMGAVARLIPALGAPAAEETFGGGGASYGEGPGGGTGGTIVPETPEQRRAREAAEAKLNKQAFDDIEFDNIRFKSKDSRLQGASQDSIDSIIQGDIDKKKDWQEEIDRARRGEGIQLMKGEGWGPLQQAAQGPAEQVSALTEKLLELKDVGIAGIAEGFSRAFEMGSIDEGVAAVKSFVAQVASAEGRLHFLQGLGKVAMSFFPPNPLARKAGVGQMAAGTALMALGGALGGGGGGGAAAGGGGLGLGTERHERDRQALSQRPEAIITMDYLDIDDPRREERLRRDLERLSGKRIKITRTFGGRG